MLFGEAFLIFNNKYLYKIANKFCLAVFFDDIFKHADHLENNVAIP